MPIPDITHLQYLLLVSLLDGERSGRDLRELLAREGHRKSAPAFYQLMARLEDARFVTGRYEVKEIDGNTFKERLYRVTASGATAVDQVRAFYLSRGRLGVQGA